MAKVLGEPARYVTTQTIKKFRHQILALFIGSNVFTGLGLYSNGKYIFLIAPVILAAMWLTNKVSDKFERQRVSFRKGATGEAMVSQTLERFPDGYNIIHDLSTPFGNIDHVVIGPTGVYAVDTKNWKGVVSSDGNGELLLNNKPTTKNEIKHYVFRMMSVREKIIVLSGLEPFINCIFAFPSAYIEAKWGSTGNVSCMTDEQLYDFIVENKKGKKLTGSEIESISRAFLALARMDKEFENPDSTKP